MAKPIDSALFPGDFPRCSLLKFLIWLSFWGVLFLAGIYAAYVVFANGLGMTGLTNYFAFGLYITFDLAVIALGAGAFFSGLLRYILNMDELKNIINLAVIGGFFCYSGAMLILTMELGQPLRAWFGFWHPNVHSMLTEVIFCISCYLLVLTIEYVPLIMEQKHLNKVPFLHNFAHNMHIFMPLFAGIGAFLSTFHQGSLGGMYGVMFARPFVFREGFFIWPWTFFLFVMSAAAVGPCFTTLICKCIELASGRQMTTWKVKQLMGKISGTMLSLYLFFKLIDTYNWAVNLLPTLGETYEQMFHGLVYGQWLFWLELGVCGVIPAVILLMKPLRNNHTLFWTACILACVGISLNRYTVTVQGLAAPVMPFDVWRVYTPRWTEILPSIMVLAYGVIIVSLSYRYLPVFPQEKELNQAPAEG
ncbi:Polysulfide reductase NrfD [Desulfovibrio sp. X2]|uniref:menaquinone reductase integral membrane subunit QrcD n=1 Tax=Desulfovibrio sp. X2 TaxID=941449 RepID=UPI000358D7B0|nr:menaquinone reductase integral membrane subunit QrcD [Desulfovibrio sp. X2]EPR41731.1 Polysulfide reductase NrfD [Desulfovibrio sp. X2]